MESLGFIDPPSATWTSTPDPEPWPTSTDESAQITGLYDIPVGKHTRNAEPTGELVRDIWDSTELHAPSLLDWKPQSVSTSKLGRRNFRWPVVIGVTFAVLVVAALGLWIYQRPDNAAAAARGEVNTQAVLLAASIDSARSIIEDLDAERLPDDVESPTALFDIGEQARAMFEASADLPTSDAIGRTAAAESAALAIEASRQLTDALAYRTALEPSLTLPLLETNPDLTDLTVATAAFTEWRAGFEAVREALPAAVTGETSTALDELSAGLDATQTAYLDAMREGNGPGAAQAIGELKAALSTIRMTLIQDMTVVSDGAGGMLDDTMVRIAPLLG
jgi:hypothetical protein